MATFADDERNCLFIHVPKTGGTSITRTLAGNGEREDLLALSPSNAQFEPHASARDARRILGARYDELFTFAFVRNPWDSLAAHYRFIQRREQHPRHEAVRNMEFRDYVAYCENGYSTPQYPAVTDRLGKIDVKFLGRFERLEADFTRVCEALGLACKLRHSNPSEPTDYREFYDDSTREAVGKMYRRDVELFGYAF